MRTTIIAFLIAAGATNLPAQSRAVDEAAIRAHAAAIESAINKRDADALAALFTTDADEINVDGPRNAGRDVMRQVWATDFTKWPKTQRFTLAVTGMRFVRQDIAIVETTGHFNEGPVRSTRGTWVSVRQDGQWLITALRVYPAQRGT
jgi:uncharacterized protein (TIGR02246 family)